MGLLFILIFIGVMLIFTVKFLAMITAIVAIGAVGITLLVLMCVWFGTSYSLKKSGYEPDGARKAYRQVDLDVARVAADLQEVRAELDEVAPLLLDLEFLRYARASRKSEKKSS